MLVENLTFVVSMEINYNSKVLIHVDSKINNRVIKDLEHVADYIVIVGNKVVLFNIKNLHIFLMELIKELIFKDFY